MIIVLALIHIYGEQIQEHVLVCFKCYSNFNNRDITKWLRRREEGHDPAWMRETIKKRILEIKDLI
jgi:hypothetical protein